MSRSIRTVFAMAGTVIAGTALAADQTLPQDYGVAIEMQLDGQTIGAPTLQLRAGREASVREERATGSSDRPGYHLTLNVVEAAQDSATLAYRLTLMDGKDARTLASAIRVPLDEPAAIRTNVRTNVIIDGNSRKLAMQFRVRPVAVQLSRLGN